MDLPEEIVLADKAVSPMVCSGKSIMDLPEEVVTDILSRIPFKTIARCKCVRKFWRSILSEPSFANLHLSRSRAGLIIHQPYWFSEYAIHDLPEVDDSPHLNINRDPVICFDLDDDFEEGEWPLCGSVNGLICLWQKDGATCICNPITREYILLPAHKYIRKSHSQPTYGFGFFKAKNEYKVVCFYERDLISTEGSNTWCEVYTLGTGMWRSLGQVPFLVSAFSKAFRYYSPYTSWYESHDGIFLRGNLHWLVYDLDTNCERVCTFDLEKEVYQLTAPPQVSEKVTFRRLGMLGECLCVCDNMCSSFDNMRLVIWVMKDYGMKESWSKEIVIPDNLGYLNGMVHPLKVFKDGTLLLLSSEDYELYYVTEDKTFYELNICFGSDHGILPPGAMVFVPSFIRLNSFMLEKVSAF